jgi:hypothetical protein
MSNLATTKRTIDPIDHTRLIDVVSTLSRRALVVRHAIEGLRHTDAPDDRDFEAVHELAWELEEALYAVSHNARVPACAPCREAQHLGLVS